VFEDFIGNDSLSARSLLSSPLAYQKPSTCQAARRRLARGLRMTVRPRSAIACAA
jgi:hypothetical protein